MLDGLFSIVAPHHCLNCGDIGSVLCSSCQNYITDEAFLTCIICAGPVSSAGSICSVHSYPYERAWCVAKRTGVIKRLIDDYKFHGAKAGCGVLAKLLDYTLPILPENTIIVAIPTTPANIRIRGYDHMQIIARQLAKTRQLELASPLLRKNNITQHFAKNAKERREQAKNFFEIKQPIDTKRPYLILDDIFTTGSTVEAAADKLKESGVSEIWLAIIAKQV